MKKTTFELDVKDCALILKSDMEVEIVLPKFSDEEVIDYENNQNVFVSMAIASLFDDEGFRNMVGERIDEMMNQFVEGECCGGECGPGCHCNSDDPSDVGC